MKKKERVLAGVILILGMAAGEAVMAQSFGVRGGLHSPFMLIRDDVEIYSDDNRFKGGFHIGGSAEFNLTEEVSFEGSLLFSTGGVRSVERFGDFTYSTSVRLYYLSVPVVVEYTTRVKGIGIYGQAGTYMAVGLSGKSVTSLSLDGHEESHTGDIDWGTDPDRDDLIRCDGGLVLGAGIRFRPLKAGLFYQHGLLNLSPYTGNGHRIKNRTLGITAVYLFSL